MEKQNKMIRQKQSKKYLERGQIIPKKSASIDIRRQRQDEDWKRKLVQTEIKENGKESEKELEKE